MCVHSNFLSDEKVLWNKHDLFTTVDEPSRMNSLFIILRVLDLHRLQLCLSLFHPVLKHFKPLITWIHAPLYVFHLIPNLLRIWINLQALSQQF